MGVINEAVALIQLIKYVSTPNPPTVVEKALGFQPTYAPKDDSQLSFQGITFLKW